MEIIEKYLDEVCSYINYVPYRRAVRRELLNHMEDSMERAGDRDYEKSAKLAIAEMGDAKEVGSRLNAHFSVRPKSRLAYYIFGVFLLYTIAALTINFSMAEMVITLLAYGVSAGLLLLSKKVDLEGNHHLIKYLYLGTLLLLAAICFSADWGQRKGSMSLGGVVLFLCVTFFVYRLHKNNTLGFIGAVSLFLLPVPIFLFSAAYAPLLLYLMTGLSTFLYFLAHGWQVRHSVRVQILLLSAVVSGGIIITGFSAVLMKWDLWQYFFLCDELNHFSYLTENFREYPLAACMSRYGCWPLVVYCIFLLLILVEFMRMKRTVHHLLGQHILNCIFMIFLVKGTFAILLNLGFPFIRSYMLPFAGFGADQAANLLLIVTAEYVYYFGDAVFGDHSFFEENRLFEVEDGKITLYYNDNYIPANAAPSVKKEQDSGVITIDAD